MKKLFALMALAMLPCLFACGQNRNETPEFKSLLVIDDENEQTQVSPEDIPTYYRAHKVPDCVEFAGEVVDLKRYDLRERMDRELIAFSYSHSISLLMLKRSTRYFPIVEPILKECGVPDDLKYLMVIESNLDPIAYSSAGAAGLWQFMTASGRQYGLEVNDNIDERYNVEKATRAACKYLKDLYRKFGSWMAVCASYNAGPGAISKKMEEQQSGNPMNLWLVQETSRYMFRVLTCKLMFEDPKSFGFILDEDDYYPYIKPRKTVTVTETIPDLASFARENGTTYYELRLANPWLRGLSLEDKSGRTYKVAIP